MTYCLAIRVNDGLVFAADTRTSAGLDDVRTYNKMHHFEVAGERSFVMLSAGNLATTQSILVQLERDWSASDGRNSLKTLFHMFDVAEYVGQVSVKAQREAAHGNTTGDFRSTVILGGRFSAKRRRCTSSIPRATASLPAPRPRTCKSVSTSTASRFSTASSARPRRSKTRRAVRW